MEDKGQDKMPEKTEHPGVVEEEATLDVTGEFGDVLVREEEPERFHPEGTAPLPEKPAAPIGDGTSDVPPPPVITPMVRPEPPPVIVGRVEPAEVTKVAVIDFSLDGLTRAFNIPPNLRIIGMRITGDHLLLKIAGAGGPPGDNVRIVSPGMATTGFWLTQWQTVDEVTAKEFPRYISWPEPAAEEPHSF